jgi:hypothetical protein
MSSAVWTLGRLSTRRGCIFFRQLQSPASVLHRVSMAHSQPGMITCSGKSKPALVTDSCLVAADAQGRTEGLRRETIGPSQRLQHRSQSKGVYDCRTMQTEWPRCRLRSERARKKLFSHSPVWLICGAASSRVRDASTRRTHRVSFPHFQFQHADHTSARSGRSRSRRKLSEKSAPNSPPDSQRACAPRDSRNHSRSAGDT